MDLPMTAEHAVRPSFRELLRLHPGWEPDLDSTYNFPSDSRKTVVVRCLIDSGRITSVGFQPGDISRQSVPELLPAGDPRFTAVVDYLSSVGADQGLDTAFTADGDQVLISATR
jgi:hypothetical protein